MAIARVRSSPAVRLLKNGLLWFHPDTGGLENVRCSEQNSFMRSFVAPWGIKQMVQSVTKQNTSSCDNVFGYGLFPVSDEANPETYLPQMRLPVRTRSAKLDVVMTEGKNGLFALVSIDRNEVLIDLSGENYILSPTRRSLQIGEKKHVFGSGETVGYLNHSCEPNSFLEFGSLCVRALRDIQRGEEVKVNYAATEYEMHDSFRCDCGSSACLQMIRGFKFLTRDQQLQLKPYLAPYLLQKLEYEISQDRHLSGQ